MNESKSNIVLIGMPAVGKSTIGVLLAKALGRNFLDTDVYIQAMEGQSLQKIIDNRGLEHFRGIEEKHISNLGVENTVIATGGSAVYSGRSMARLSETGVIVHLDLPLADIEARLTDISTRGLVMEPGESVATLYQKRMPLYREWAELTVDCAALSHQQVIEKITQSL